MDVLSVKNKATPSIQSMYFDWDKHINLGQNNIYSYENINLFNISIKIPLNKVNS